MSTLKVTNIESPSGGGVNAKIADVNGGQLSNRNLNINGAMQGCHSVGQVVNAVMRIFWARPIQIRYQNDGAFTISQSTDTPSGQGFSNSLGKQMSLLLWHRIK